MTAHSDPRPMLRACADSTAPPSAFTDGGLTWVLDDEMRARRRHGDRGL